MTNNPNWTITFDPSQSTNHNNLQSTNHNLSITIDQSILVLEHLWIYLLLLSSFGCICCISWYAVSIANDYAIKRGKKIKKSLPWWAHRRWRGNRCRWAPGPGRSAWRPRSGPTSPKHGIDILIERLIFLLCVQEVVIHFIQ